MKRNIIIILISFITLLYSENKIGLVLSGGGVKGMGHIGTLQLIDSLNIPIDYIVGTSIGSIAAGLYASGYSADEIEYLSFNTNWDEIFSQNKKRNHLYFFQKLNSNSHQLEFELNEFKPTPPLGLTNGQYSYEYLSNLFNVYNGINNFDELYIPFKCNAVDLISGEEIIFETGSIATALRASTSIPTVFSPIEYNNYLLIDGGIKNNFPTNLVKNMGADFIIGVNVSSQEKNKDDIKSVLDIISTTFNLYNKQQTKNNVDLANILIEPKFQNISSINFDISTMNKFNNNGKQTAYEKIEELKALHSKLNISNEYLKLSSLKNNFIINSISLDTSILESSIILDILNPYIGINISKNTFIKLITKIRDLKKYKNLHYKFKQKNIQNISYELFIKAESIQPIILSDIVIRGNNKLSNDFLKSIFNYNNGDTLSIQDLEKKIQGAYTLDYFKYIFYEVQKINKTEYNLIIDVKENNFKRLYVGAFWDNYYQLIGKLKLELLNKPATNFRIHNQLYFSGIRKNVSSIYYTIHKDNTLIMSPFISITKGIENKPNSKIDYSINTIGINFPLKQYGNISIRTNNEKCKENHVLSSDQIFDYNYNSVHIDIDQLDNILYPKRGYKITHDYESNNSYNISKIKLDYFHTFKFNHTIRLYSLIHQTSINAPNYKNFIYGGYNWLPGYNEFSLSSSNLSLIGFEYQIHYKNSTTFKFLINKIPQYAESNNSLPISYGVAINIKSILGPFNFTWARGLKNPAISTNVNKHNIFYFNFGVTY